MKGIKIDMAIKRNDSNAGIIFVILIVAIVVIALWFATPWLAAKFAESMDLTHRGAFGDQYGFINALFSGLAFAGVIAAILLQTRELKYQREELEDTRDELKQSRIQLKSQAESLTKQNFENTFFQMIRLHNEIVTTTIYGQPNNQFISRLAFEKLYEAYLNSRNAQFRDNPNLDQNNLDGVYRGFFRSNEKYLGHYFRNIYRNVKYIDESNIENKDFYIGVLRAQLSANELALLAYNAISPLGRDKMLPLARKFALFNNLNIETLHAQSDAAFLGEEAFGNP